MLRVIAGLAKQGRQGLALSSQIVRPFSAAAVAPGRKPVEWNDPTWTPPITFYGIPGRYASALFTAAGKANLLDTVQIELNQINELAENSAAFGAWLKDPSISKKEKESGLAEILKKEDVSDTTKQFFAVLAQNNRLRDLAKINETFDKIIAAARGEATVKITSAQALEPEELDRIVDLSRQLVDGREVRNLLVEQAVDPKIMGGFILDIGEKHIDLSILTRVKKVQQLIVEAV